MAKAKKVSITSLRRENKVLDAALAHARGVERLLRSDLSDKNADINRMVERLADVRVKFAGMEGQYIGYRRRVLELDGMAASEPASAAAGKSIVSERPSAEQLLDWFDPPELVDIGLGADDQDLADGRLGSDAPR